MGVREKQLSGFGQMSFLNLFVCHNTFHLEYLSEHLKLVFTNMSFHDKTDLNLFELPLEWKKKREEQRRKTDRERDIRDERVREGESTPVCLSMIQEGRYQFSLCLEECRMINTSLSRSEVSLIGLDRPCSRCVFSSSCRAHLGPVPFLPSWTSLTPCTTFLGICTEQGPWFHRSPDDHRHNGDE